MMIRSIPPASAHLALRPVPAPPPMIGTPWATFRRNLSSISLRDIWHIAASGGRNPAEQAEQVSRGRGRERGVVDVLVPRLDPHPGVPGEPPGDGLEQGAVGVGVVERAAGGVERRDA